MAVQERTIGGVGEIQDSNSAFSLRGSTWSTLVLAIGIVVPCLFRLLGFLDIDGAIKFIAVTVLVGGFFLLFPILSRERKLKDLPRFRFPKLTFKQVAIETGIAICMTIVCLFLTIVLRAFGSYLGFDVSAPPELERLTKSTDYVLISIYMSLGVLLAPVAEEIFFRGFLYNAIKSRIGVVAGAILSSLLFGFGHTYSNFWALVELSIFGIVLVGVYSWRKTILSTILIHLFFNLFAMLTLLSAILFYANYDRTKLVIGVNCLDTPDKCVVYFVKPDSPADKAGLLKGDQIVEFDEYAINNFEDLRNALYWKGQKEKVDEEYEVIELKVRRVEGERILMRVRPVRSQDLQPAE